MFVLVFKSLLGAYLEGPWNSLTGAQVERYWLFKENNKNKKKKKMSRNSVQVSFFFCFLLLRLLPGADCCEARGWQEFQELAVVWHEAWKKAGEKDQGREKGGEGRGGCGGEAGLTGQRVTMKGWGGEESREGKDRTGKGGGRERRKYEQKLK